MSDALQCVIWTLERSCRLRASPESITLPGPALNSIGRAQACAQSLSDGRGERFGIFGDIYVSSYTPIHPPVVTPSIRGGIPYPLSGFRISEEFADAGGLERVVEMCRACPANTTPGGFASCAGHLPEFGFSRRSDALLRQIVARLGLDDVFAENFAPMKLLWLSLWASSPFPRPALKPLQRVLAALLEEDAALPDRDSPFSSSDRQDLEAFIHALEAAAVHDLPLHVRMSPPGHADFGMWTTFPHCPLCKAGTEYTWGAPYPTELRPCENCGTEFSPGETGYGRKEMTSESRAELREALGEEGFRQFAIQYLMALGHSERDAAQLVTHKEREDAEREATLQGNRELKARGLQFVQEHVYANLPCLPLPPGYLPRTSGAPDQSTGWFDAPTFETVLKRFKNLHIEVTNIDHYSTDEELRRSINCKYTPALTFLALWRKDGCNEAFNATFEVPESVLSGRRRFLGFQLPW